MIIVDSSVWIDHFNGKRTPSVGVLHACLGARELGVGDLILCEVLQGFRHDRDFALALRSLTSFPAFEMVGAGISEKAARHHRSLRRRGVTVRKTMDLLIATFVIERRFQLLHSARDFDPFEEHLGLEVLRA